MAIAEKGELDLREMGKDELLQVIGDVRQTVADLNALGANTRGLEAAREQILAQYPDRWVAFHDGEVVADSESIDGLLETVSKLGLRWDLTARRLMETAPKTLIL